MKVIGLNVRRCTFRTGRFGMELWSVTHQTTPQGTQIWGFQPWAPAGVLAHALASISLHETAWYPPETSPKTGFHHRDEPSSLSF
jgi:hypothetical protein